MKPAWRAPAAAALAALLAGCGSAPEHPAPVHHASRAHHRAVAAAVSPPPAAGGQYVVQRGDTLYAIAFRNQLDYHDLASWNGIGRDYRINVGQRLRLSAPDGEAPPPVVIATDPDAPPPAASAVPYAPPAAAAPRRTAPTPVPAPVVVASIPAGNAPVPAASPDTDVAPLPGFEHWTWPTHGSVARRFGVDGSKGVDLAGSSGQVIVAAAGGKVVYSGSALKGYGELIIVKHDEQYLSAYGYNSRRLVEEGQMVQAGQPIAEMGVGPEQQPMLHFEIRDKGRPIDPLPLLPRM